MNTIQKEPVVSLRNVKRTYQMGKIKVPALRGINYDFYDGFTIVVGPSGSGKSTLLNSIGCLDNLAEGEISFEGNLITQMTEKQLSWIRRNKIGFIFQSFSLIPVLSVFDNVEYPLLRSSLSVAERRERVLALLSGVGLSDLVKRFPRELSGGQMQRVAIARALVAHPKLIIADEPTANLDSKTGDSILELLAGMQKEHGASIIIASHDSNVLSQFNRKLFIKDGLIDDSKS